MSLNPTHGSPRFALTLETEANAKFEADESDAKDRQRGLWRGCFVSPQSFRQRTLDTTLLGSSCRTDKDRELRDALFPDEPQMPSGCSIKGKLAVRARFTGISAFINCEDVRVTRHWRIRIAGFAAKAMLRPRGFAKPTIAGLKIDEQLRSQEAATIQGDGLSFSPFQFHQMMNEPVNAV